MNTITTLLNIKLHTDENSIPDGLTHISQNLPIEDLMIKIGQFIHEDFYIVSNTKSGEKETILHYSGENYSLDFSAYLYPHFQVTQTLKRLVADKYTCFLYQPMFKNSIYALLVIDNNTLNDFIAKESFWFDKNFAQLQDGFDGFSELNAMQKTKKNPHNGHKLTPEQKKENDFNLDYDFSRSEHNKNHTMNGFTKSLIVFLGIILIMAGVFMYVTFSKADQSWTSKSRALKQTFSFITPTVDEVDNTTLEIYVGKLVYVPAGTFEMGMVDKYNKTTQPIHSVTVPTFQMMEAEVTFKQWDACVDDGGCSVKPKDQSWGRGQHPVINISYDEIVDEYIPWLYKKTGYEFELPSEAQWEYAAKGGSATPITLYCTAANFGRHKNHRDNKAQCGQENQHTIPIKSYAPNAYGLYDMCGNVEEWVNDLHHDSYEGAPTDGSAWTAPSSGEVEKKLHKDFLIPVRGGCFSSSPRLAQASSRSYLAAQKSSNTTGFRLVLKKTSTKS